MASKTIVLITGGNTGIGYEVVKALLGSDRLYHILLAGRDIKKAEEAARSSTAEVKSESTVEAVQIDVEDDGSISKAFEEVSSKHCKIDCLINNAGEEIVIICLHHGQY
jgi:NAD(P)-dependent dehydrogenase (short-subunit alcohol dehydrogenase family)